MKDVTTEDLKLYVISSTIIVTLIIIGGALESTFLFLTKFGLILLVSMLRVTFNKYAASKGSFTEEIRRIQFVAETAMGMLSLLGLSASLGGLVGFSFLELLAGSFAEWIIKKNK